MEIKDKKEQKQIKENAENINEIKEKNSNESSFQKTLLIILFIVFSSFLVVYIFKLNKFKKHEKEIKKINEEKIKENENEKQETKEDEKNIKKEETKKAKILDENLKKTDLLFSEKIKKYFVSNELLVKLKENEDINSLNEFLKANGGESFILDEKNKIYKVKFNRVLNETILLEYIVKLNKLSSVENAILNLLTEEEFNNLK